MKIIARKTLDWIQLPYTIISLCTLNKLRRKMAIDIMSSVTYGWRKKTLPYRITLWCLKFVDSISFKKSNRKTPAGNHILSILSIAWNSEAFMISIPLITIHVKFKWSENEKATTQEKDNSAAQ